MQNNFSFYSEIEELKKAILTEPPEDIFNSNSNSKDKLNGINKREKDVALEFLRKFNEEQEKITYERKMKELEEKINHKRNLEESKTNNKQELPSQTSKSYQNLSQKFSRLANLKDLEEFNEVVVRGTDVSQIKKRKIPFDIKSKVLKRIKQTTRNSGENHQKLKIEFKDARGSNQNSNNKEKENGLLKLYQQEEKKYKETPFLSFKGIVKNSIKNSEVWFLDIEKLGEKQEKTKLFFKGVFNTQKDSNFVNENGGRSKKETFIKNIQVGKQYIFEFKSAPKKFKDTFLVFIENMREIT